MLDSFPHEPARSYDAGAYLWGCGFAVDQFIGHQLELDSAILNQGTVAYAFENIQRSFDFDHPDGSVIEEPDLSAFIPT